MFKSIINLFKNHLFTAFIPWIFFSSFFGMSKELTFFASVGALALMFLLNMREIKKGFVLPWGSIIIFFFLAINSQYTFWSWAESHAFLIANSALAIIVCFSMLIGKPFTLQYAREVTPPSKHQNPKFLRINWILTSVWAVLMIIMALPSYFLTQERILDSWFWNYGLSIICIVIGLKCNTFIPKLLKKNK